MLISMGGGGAGKGSTLIIDTAMLRAISNGEVNDALNTVETSLTNFRNPVVDTHHFGDFDAGRDLGRLHSAVQGVFVSTIEGVRTDTSTFGDNLRLGAQRYDDADADAGRDSRAISSALLTGSANGGGGGGAPVQNEPASGEQPDVQPVLASDREFDAAREELQDSLDWAHGGDAESVVVPATPHESEPNRDSGPTWDQY